MNQLYFIGMVFEGIIIVLTLCLLIPISIKLIKKNRNDLTLLLFLLILNYFIAIFFSWLSKVHILYLNIDYLYDESVLDPLTPLSWILLRISDFRFSFLFITLASVFSYIFKVKLFDADSRKSKSVIIIFYGFLTAFYSLIIYEKGNLMLDVLAFFLVFVLMSIVYIPFMISSISTYRNSSAAIYKNAFFSLAIMSLSFVMILLCFLIDRIYIFMGDFGFTPFYYMGWIFVIIGVFGAYIGYVHLREKKNEK